MELHISSTEPLAFRSIGLSSTHSEEFGCDAMIVNTKGERLGIQRKRFPDDLVASLSASKSGPNRIAKQVDLMQDLDMGVFVFEGTPFWSESGNAVVSGSNWGTHSQDHGRLTESMVDSVVMSLARAGFTVVWSDDLKDTIRLVQGWAKWWDKPAHTLLELQPMRSDVTGMDKAARRRVRNGAALQVAPGIGVKLAKEVAKVATLKLDCAKSDLATIKGLGSAKLEALWEQFGNE